MNIISQRESADFVWNRQLDNEDTTLLVFHQNERGFASFLAGMGLIGDERPVCRVFSKLFQVEAYNSAPDPTFPEWRLFETRNMDGRRFFILRITHSYPLPEPHAPDHTWLYTYPILRDIVMELNRYGVNELAYLTTNLLQGSLNYNYEELANIPSSEVGVFDYINHEDEVLTLNGDYIDRDLVLSCPSWTFGAVFKNFCTNPLRGVWLVIGGYNPTTFIDTKSADSLVDYCDIVLGLKAEPRIMRKLTDILCDLEDLTSPTNLDRILANQMGDYLDEFL